MSATRNPDRQKARVLLAVERGGGACKWRDVPTSPADAMRAAVDALLAVGVLREVWCQPAAGGNPSHWLLLPEYPEERLPGRVLPGPPAPTRAAQSPGGATGSAPAPSAGERIPCPWCHAGRILLHGPEEPWEVTEDLSEEPQERYVAGLKRFTFTAAPCEWFSCSSCAMTGTLGYLAAILAKTTNVRTGGCPGVHPAMLPTPAP